ncbi:hypothetical protein Pmani_015457 [Petrolisthes manimaculis]|uniref:Uncharacterized protein n=1 Tax=Petrolisthes manimaculis TaxID=1843537 RepID=A0AAE1U7C7_9EUCA|nr:hypothetical protein Pmani_015457 [Petrolisthes manimaculis]
MPEQEDSGGQPHQGDRRQEASDASYIGVIHWNSHYESCAGLLEVLEESEKKDELNVVLSAFYEGDKDMLAQYCKIMKPVAICLDILQSGDNAYMDILLPNLKLMKDQVAASSLED